MIIKKAYGCYIEDDQGKVYIDTTMGSGAQILGHGNKLIKKITAQVEDGTIYTVPNFHTQEVCKLLKKINPEYSEKYIFCNSGTEANMRAIRLARAFTGKKIIGRFHGGWHGGLDGFIDEHPDNHGVPDEINNLYRVLPYNQDECFDMIDDTLAAVIIEPAQGSNPRDDVGPFLKKLQAKCKKAGVLLILDEIMTGFRLSKKGGAGIFGITGDIVTYGKVLGGGFPIGAVGGKEKIINTKNVFYGGTFSANPLSMFSANNILMAIEAGSVIDYDYLYKIGNKFRSHLNDFFQKNNKHIRVIGIGPLSRIVFTNHFIRNRKDRDQLESSQKKQAIFYNLLLENGVFVNGNRLFHLSMCHSEEVVQELIDKIKKVSLNLL